MNEIMAAWILGSFILGTAAGFAMGAVIMYRAHKNTMDNINNELDNALAAVKDINDSLDGLKR